MGHLKYYVLAIAATLLLTKFAGLYAVNKANAVSSKEFGRQKFKEKIVYDVSEVIRSSKNHNHTEILPEDLYARENNTSTSYYFVVNDGEHCWWNWEDQSGSKELCNRFDIKGISVMFSSNASYKKLLAMAELPITNSTIVNLLKMDKSLIDSVTILLRKGESCRAMPNIHRYLVESLKVKNIKKAIKIGVEYNDDFLKSCARSWVPNFETLDHTVLRINISPMTTMLSYDKFFRQMNQIIQKNRIFVRKLNPKCTQYIRIYNEHWNATISENNYGEYDALMATYLRTFSKQVGEWEIYIFNPILKRLHIVPSNVYFRQNVSPVYFPLVPPEFENITEYIPLLACLHQQLITTMVSNVKNILVFDRRQEVPGSLLAPCNTSTKNAQSYFNSPPNTSFTLVLSTDEGKLGIEEQVEEVVEMLREKPIGIKISRICISEVEDLNKSRSLKNVVNLLQSQNIDVCCINSNSNHKYNEHVIENISAITQRIRKHCGSLLKFSKEIVQYIEFEIKRPEELLSFLHRFHQEKQYFEGLYPGITLTPKINIRNSNSTKMEKYRDSLYCSVGVKQINENYETVNSFANIHRWSRLVFKSDVNEMGIWNMVTTDSEIDQHELTFFVLFRSNAPLTANEKLPMTYPCIEKTEDASQSNINFLENKYSGVTFQTNLWETLLSTAELQTTLQLATDHFPSVELIAVSQEDFKLAEKVIQTHYPNSLNLPNLSLPFVYIQLSLADAHGLQQSIFRILSNKHSAVHVSNWESLSYEQQDLWKSFEYSSIPNFGVTVKSCTEEVNSRLAKLKRLPFISQVSYIVCDAKPVWPENGHVFQMEEYLGTLFYIKSFIEHFLPIQKETGRRVEVMFRLNFDCLNVNEMEMFLRFLNDVNQHSAAFKIRYFLVRAFEKESSSAGCSDTWWRLDDYADLSNLSIYVNREDEFAGREARIQIQPSPAPVPEQNSNQIYLIIFVPIATFLIIVVLALWLNERKQKTRILTQVEVRQFYNGIDQSYLTNPNSYNLDFGNMKFPKHYEISPKDIQTEEIVGSGQFGVVHRGYLSKRVEVAIKIPRIDCGKEQFKSTLAELKILCHIGEHSNIVSFLGARTKDIANGNLQIVIEYCKKGCLLSYLRQNRQNGNEAGPSLSLFELNGFSLQIASGMEYIAEKRVIHGDLAARNVLLTSELTCKIADFGLSRRLYEMNEYVKSSQEPLPWRWMAPESLRDMEFTTKSDVWSYGVTLWEIFSFGMVPYPGLNWTENYVTELESGMRMGKAPHATDTIHAKTLDCWNQSSDARPTFTELREFFVGLRNQQYVKLDHA